jgi:hypothetical protein
MTGRSLGLCMLTIVTIIAFSVPGWSQNETSQTTTGAAPASSGIRIEDAVVCQDVVNRQPVGAGDVIAKENAKVYCFTRVVGAEGETTVTHNWYYQGTLKSSVQLKVKSPDWRTWSSKTLEPSWIGQWMVEVIGADGAPLESIIFFVQ